jgi:hypothetical protein
MKVTDSVSECLVRLPLWVGLEEQQERVIETLLLVLDRRGQPSPLPDADVQESLQATDQR